MSEFSAIGAVAGAAIKECPNPDCLGHQEKWQFWQNERVCSYCGSRLVDTPEDGQAEPATPASAYAAPLTTDARSNEPTMVQHPYDRADRFYGDNQLDAPLPHDEYGYDYEDEPLEGELVAQESVSRWGLGLLLLVLTLIILGGYFVFTRFFAGATVQENNAAVSAAERSTATAVVVRTAAAATTMTAIANSSDPTAAAAAATSSAATAIALGDLDRATTITPEAGLGDPATATLQPGIAPFPTATPLLLLSSQPTAPPLPVAANAQVGNVRLVDTCTAGQKPLDVQSYTPAQDFYVLVQADFGRNAVREIYTVWQGPPGFNTTYKAEQGTLSFDNGNPTARLTREGSYYLCFRARKQAANWTAGDYRLYIYINNQPNPASERLFKVQ